MKDRVPVKAGTLSFYGILRNLLPHRLVLMQQRVLFAWEMAQQSFSKGDLDAALLSCTEVISGAPAFAGAHWMVSRIYQAQTRFRLAVFHARQAARLLTDASSMKERLNVSRRLVSTGEYRAAADLLDTFDKSLLRDAWSIEEACQIATMLDSPSEVLAWIDIAEKQGIKSSTLSYMRGNALKFTGQWEEARIAYEDAIRQSPLDGYYHLALATLGAEGAAQRIDRIRRILTGISRRDNDVGSFAAAGFALFKELDAVDEVDAAWNALRAALWEKRRTIQYSSSSDQRVHSMLLDDFRARQSCRTHDDENLEGKRPIFIVGMPRTGTTLVERMLGNHSKITACGELSELRMAYKWSIDYYSPGIVDEPSAQRAAQVDLSMMGKIYRGATHWRAGTGWFTDKHPGNLALIGMVLHSLPEARIVFVKRNPMDTCFSNLKEFFRPSYYEYSYDIDEVAAHYLTCQRFMRELASHDLGRILMVEYEDLVREPSLTIRKILDHCALPVETGLEDVTRNSNPVTTASSVQVRRGVHGDNLGGWKRYGRHLGPLEQALARS